MVFRHFDPSGINGRTLVSAVKLHTTKFKAIQMYVRLLYRDDLRKGLDSSLGSM